MKYALFIVSLPDIESRAVQAALLNFLLSIEKTLGTRSPASMLNPCAFLCDLDNGLGELAGLLAAAQERGYETRTLFFDQAPSFVITKSKDA